MASKNSAQARLLYERIGAPEAQVDVDDVRALLESLGFVMRPGRRAGSHVTFTLGSHSVTILRPVSSRLLNRRYVESLLALVDDLRQDVYADVAEPKAEKTHSVLRSDSSFADSDRFIRTGLNSSAWEDLQRFGYDNSELAGVVGCDEGTISAKAKSHERLDAVQGDRTLRLAAITADAVDAFGDPTKALRWMRKANRAIAGQRPIELIATEDGLRLVRRSLNVIEYGGLA